MAAGAGTPSKRSIRRLTSESEADALIGLLLDDYLRWVFSGLRAAGLQFPDPDGVIAKHHGVFRAEVPDLVAGRGRLLVALIDGVPVGVGALLPVDQSLAEIKRMYVSGGMQGRGVGRSILQKLLDDARAEGFLRARLETQHFMVRAIALYESLGFVRSRAFAESEAALSGVEGLTHYMEVAL